MTARIAVCALTMRRPLGLATLLDGLAAQRIDVDSIDLEVIIIDNDAAGSGRDVVRSRPDFPWPIRYEIEGSRGIPIARNRAVEVAEVADFVAFIDDDEVPDPDWLDELVRVQRRTGADVVTGPVLPVFSSDPPPWILRGRFFDRPRFPTGQELEWATTSNVLISRHLLDGTPFNAAMRLTGGSDTHFFMRVHAAGARIVWADDALVHEHIPTSRMTGRWLLRREYRRGNTLSLCLLDLADSPWRRFRRTVRGTGLILKGLIGVVPGALRGRTGIVLSLRISSFGAGMIAGLAGRRYEEYRTLHGA